VYCSILDSLLDSLLDSFEEFCKVENKENKMTVYLVEVEIAGLLQPIAIKTNWASAHYLVNGKNGYITEMIVGKEYPNGLQTCLYRNYREE